MPSFPTDSLYKLLTFVGAAFVVISAYLILATPTLSIAPYAKDFPRPQIDIIEGRLASAGVIGSQERRGKRDAKEMYDYFRQLIDMVHDKEAAKELRELNEKLYLSWTNFPYQLSDTKIRLKIAAILAALGAGTAIIGLWKWYVNHQIYQDILIREQAMLARLNTAKNCCCHCGVVRDSPDEPATDQSGNTT